MATAPANVEQQKPKLPAIKPPRLEYHPLVEERFGIDRASWKALVEAVFPNATSIDSVILALSYCKARRLDPMKRNVHIVPIWDRKQKCMVDTIWPGIGELRTTAFRTGEYAGRGETVFGPDVTQVVGKKEITFPLWAQITVKRFIKGTIVEFCGPRVYWLETYATYSREDDSPNEMWSSRPRGQIDKCAEAAALRCAFPEEIGGEYIPEEVQHVTGPTFENKGNASPKTLDELGEALTKGLPEPGTAEQTQEEAGEPSKEPSKPDGEGGDPLSHYAADLRTASKLTEVGAVYDEWFGPNASEVFSAEDNARAVAMRDARKEEIRAAAAASKK